MGGVGVSFAGALEEDFDVGFFHFLADFVVNDHPAVPVEDRAEEVERPGDVEVTDVDVPVLVRGERLLEAGPLFGR